MDYHPIRMKSRSEWFSFGLFLVAVLGALFLLLRHGGVHGQSAALARAESASAITRCVWSEAQALLRDTVIDRR